MLTKTNTSWNASLYDDKHSFVFKYGEDPISMLAPQAGERILDLGCGTGHLTQQISITGARMATAASICWRAGSMKSETRMPASISRATRGASCSRWPAAG